MAKIKILKKKEVFQDKRERLVNEEVILSNNKKNNFLVSYFNSFVVVIPKQNEKILLLKQYRHGGKREYLGFPGGFINTDETPLNAAKRELAEETGLSIKKISLLGKLRENVARSRLPFYVYLAEVVGIEDTTKNQDLLEVDIKAKWFDIKDLLTRREMLKIESSITLSSILLLVEKLGKLK